MEKKTVFKHIVIVALPLFVGFLVSTVDLARQLFINLIWVFALAFVAFWFWAGQKTFDDYKNKVAGVVIENSVWLLSLLVFIWQFLLTGDALRINALAAASMYYVVLLTPLSALFYISSEVIPANAAVLLTLGCFLLMALIFAGGFISRYLTLKKKRRQLEQNKDAASARELSDIETRIETLYGGSDQDGGQR